ncbi:recombinase family protein [Bacillus sp. 7884-1]|uniref:recombinase family protein n=1 Tax=Bacillus sp. 7884-1 TaxID=2021693 RepID=UPI000BA57CE6|nr:recombinase family protein [Bacillus sp. 7884-1]PAE37552.1 DNA recombinase [Bacillus sp. 7884-1]
MDVRRFGYIRISDKYQSDGHHLDTFKKIQLDKRNIFIDKQSGKDFSRFQYKVLKGMLSQGDVVYLHSLNCLGQNKQEILSEWTDITKKIQADIVVLNMPLVNTTQFKDSLESYITDLVIQILSWTASEESEPIRKKQSEGFILAMQNGSSFGRPKAKITEEFEHVYRKWKAGEIKAVRAMQEAGVGKTTFYKLVKEYENSLKIESI